MEKELYEHPLKATRVYEAPRIWRVSVESEGSFCGSVVPDHYKDEVSITKQDLGTEVDWTNESWDTTPASTSGNGKSF